MVPGTLVALDRGGRPESRRSAPDVPLVSASPSPRRRRHTRRRRRTGEHTVDGEQADQSLHLVDSGTSGIHRRVVMRRASSGCGPAVGGPVQLTDPLIGPPGNDRLSSRAWTPSSGSPARDCTRRRGGPRSRRQRRRQEASPLDRAQPTAPATGWESTSPSARAL